MSHVRRTDAVARMSDGNRSAKGVTPTTANEAAICQSGRMPLCSQTWLAVQSR
jgi:hypothetical protein